MTFPNGTSLCANLAESEVVRNLCHNSAHLASLAAPDTDRWLTLLWAMDNYKVSQATNAAKNAGWKMPRKPRRALARVGWKVNPWRVPPGRVT